LIRERMKLRGIWNYDNQIKHLLALFLCILIFITGITWPSNAFAAEMTSSVSNTGSTVSTTNTGELHAFYPAYVAFSDQIKQYINSLDSLSFAWSRIDSEDPTTLNTVKGKNGNYGFYYPADYLQVVKYAKSQGKSIQLNVYMDGSDSTVLLPDAAKRQTLVQTIMNGIAADISTGEGIYYDGVVVDFEGLCNTDSKNNPILYNGQPISMYFVQFLTELKAQLTTSGKKLYVAVNPLLYYDGYDYASILGIADRVILMAHDYEPTGQLQKKQVEQYTDYDALQPIDSLAPIGQIRLALNDMKNATSDSAQLSKIWLQLTFDSAQWQFDVNSASEWAALDGAAVSRKGRSAPLYSSIKARVDNVDGNGKNISYGYNNDLQSPYIQYFNSSDKSWNVIIYEDSNSISSKIELSKEYGLGGISIWNIGNVPDYNDSTGLKYHLDGWSTILSEMSSFATLSTDQTQTVTFTDTVVEQAVREKLGNKTGSLTIADMKSIYRLKLPVGTLSLNDLKMLTNLEYLNATNLSLKSITALSTLKNLRVLYLPQNSISDVSPLKSLTQLQVLSLKGNQIASISSLSGLTNLQKLYLSENKLASVSSLSKLTKLEVLELSNNSIQKVDGLKGLKKLTRLTLAYNKLSDLTPLQALINLQYLDLSDNKITDITALTNLKKIKTLYLQRNYISNIKALSGMSKLTLLSLNGNKVSALYPLEKLTGLEKLYLKENRLTSILSLKLLTNLKELYLSGNTISNYSPVKDIYNKTGFLCDFNM
jgi:internalin A